MPDPAPLLCDLVCWSHLWHVRSMDKAAAALDAIATVWGSVSTKRTSLRHRFMAADNLFKWKLMVLRTFGFFACQEEHLKMCTAYP